MKLQRRSCWRRCRNLLIVRPTPSITSRTSLTRSCCCRRTLLQLSPGSHATSRRAVCWAIPGQPLRRTVRDGGMLLQRAWPLHWKRWSAIRATPRHERAASGRLRQWRAPRTGCSLPYVRRSRVVFGSLLSVALGSALQSTPYSADAPALWARHRFDGCLCPSGLVRSAWIQRRDSGCARPRRFRRRVLPFQIRGPRWTGDHFLASHSIRIEWPRRHVRLLLSRFDATVGRCRAAGRFAVHRAGDDGVRPLPRLVLSPGSLALGIEPGLGLADAEG